MSRGFWQGATAKTAYWLSCGLGFFVLANIGVQYGLNVWNKYFFDALEKKDVSMAGHAITLFLVLAVVAVLVIVGTVWFRMTIQAEWRRWITSMLSGEWLKNRHFYQLNIAAPEVDNPEFRMTDDVRLSVESIIDFVIGITNALLMSLVFIGVLWSVGGSITLGSITIPGYYIVAAAVYGLVTSGLMLFLGRPLVGYTESKNAAEARNRFELVRIKENAESIALIGGEEDEKRAINETLQEVIQRWAAVIRQQSIITVMTHSNALLTPILPLLIGAPKYLAGELSLGQLMQLAAAFVQVQLSFNWLVDNYIRLAEWQASTGRVTGLWRSLREFQAEQDTQERIVIVPSTDDHIRIIDLSVAHHSGRVVVDSAETDIAPNDKVLIKGESGSGKSTLIRAIAGLWPWGSGRVELPENASVIFQPQKPYIPLGTLRSALLYPRTDVNFSDDQVKEALVRCGLRNLTQRLDDNERWDRMLSGGEQQRLGFARLLLQKPDIVILDEATSALDEDSQYSLMSLFNEELSKATLISVGHRPGLEDFHTRVIELSIRKHGAQIVEADLVRREKQELAFLTRVLRRAMRRQNQ